MASAQTGEEAAAQRARLTPEDESEWEYEYSTTETEVLITYPLSTSYTTNPGRRLSFFQTTNQAV